MLKNSKSKSDKMQAEAFKLPTCLRQEAAKMDLPGLIYHPFFLHHFLSFSLLHPINETIPGPWVPMESLYQGPPRSVRSRRPGRWPSSRPRWTRSSGSCTRTWRTCWRGTGSSGTWRRELTPCKMDVLSLKSRSHSYHLIFIIKWTIKRGFTFALLLTS